MKNKTKKIIALLMLILTLCTSLPINTFAAFITDINSNASFGVIPGSKENYGHELHCATYDGVTYLVFCTQFGATSPGGDYTYNGDFIVHYKNSAPQYERIAEMIYFRLHNELWIWNSKFCRSNASSSLYSAMGLGIHT